jgi:ATP-dependent Clp protease protease subunit
MTEKADYDGHHISPDDATLPTPKSRDLFFNKQVDQSSIAELSQSIITINKNDEYLNKLYPVYGLSYKPAPIKIYIDSYGGSVYQCFGLLSIMDNSQTPIHTIVTGTAMSCGFMMAIHGHKRFAMRNSTLMFHQVGSAVWGKLKDMEEEISEVQRLQKRIMEMTVKRTKISLAKLEENYKTKTDWYMDADEALANGVIDKILGV